MSHTLAEKILARAAGREEVTPGDIIEAKVDLAMGHEATAQAAEPFERMGGTTVWDPDRVVITVDHWVPASSEMTATLHKGVRDFVKKAGVKHWFDIGRHGICHQLLAENGFILPGDLVVGSDSHTVMGGGLAAFSTGIGPTELAAVLITGSIWLKVPATVRITVDGKLPPSVSGKDVILRVAKELTVTGGIYRSLEYRGSCIDTLPMPDRLTISNMAVELGGKAGLMPGDSITKGYLEKIARRPMRDNLPLRGDEDAPVERELHLDVDSLEPQVAKPWSPDNVVDIGEVVGVKIDQVFLGSCTNSRIEDLRIAAKIMEGHKCHPDTRMIVSPASQAIYRQAAAEGLLEILADAECVVTASSCGPCFGGHMGILGPTDTCLSTSNRNFVGRMGSRTAKVYLASPAVAAATAIKGEIADPRSLA